MALLFCDYRAHTLYMKIEFCSKLLVGVRDVALFHNSSWNDSIKPSLLVSFINLFCIYKGYLFRNFFVLRGLDTLGRFSSVSVKGDNFCDFLIASLYNEPLLIRGLLQKERRKEVFRYSVPLLIRGLLQKKRICSPWEQILSFCSRPLRRETIILKE